MQMWLGRHASTGNHVEQSHEYDVNDTQTACTNSLGNCHVTDNSSLGTYGRISLNFSPTAPATNRNDVCFSDHSTVVGVFHERKGMLTGTFRLNTGTGYFGSITDGGHGVHIPAAIPATATRYQSNGMSCPPDPPSGCVAGLAIFPTPAPSDDKFANAEKDSLSAQGNMQFTWQPATGNDKVELRHTIFGYVPKKSLKITSNTPAKLEHVRANFNQLGPFVSGVASFNASAPPQFGSTCHEVDRAGNLVGPLTVHFDGFGTVHYSSGAAFAYWSQSS
jgi:hypothetical protein